MATRRDARVAIIGAGVVGLAAAAALARAGRSVIVFEQQGGIARGVTSRNSQVIHAGIYYPRESLKARLCVAGREALYERCARWRVPHRRLGKLVVAVRDDEVPILETLREQGRANGAPGLELLDARAVRELEPQLEVRAALLSPATGIVDAHALASSYRAEAEAHEAQVLLDCEVEGVESGGVGYVLRVRRRDGARERMDFAAVVNAAGLDGGRVAALAGIDVDACGYRQHPCKGDYFALAPAAPISLSRLVYPVPGTAGLGIHATLDLGGRLRFGPDAEYVRTRSYEVDACKRRRFAEAIRGYLPALESAWLTPDGAGIRPKLAAPDEHFRDFVVAEEGRAGLPGFVNCLGIESPGLTAAGAIADRVVALLSPL